MTVLAITVFVVAYALIASDRVNKTLVALAGAAVVVALGVVESEDVFFSRETGIDWDVIFLLFGMMIIVSVLRQTGVFEYIAIWAAKRANGSPLRIMILLVLVTASHRRCWTTSPRCCWSRRSRCWCAIGWRSTRRHF